MQIFDISCSGKQEWVTKISELIDRLDADAELYIKVFAYNNLIKTI